MQPMPLAAIPIPDWSQICLRRLHRVLELTPEAAPWELAPMEAFALLEWCRIAVYAECHAAGVGEAARTMLRCPGPMPGRSRGATPRR